MTGSGSPQHGTGTLRGMRVLLVEDTALVAHELKRMLAMEGCEVAEHCDTLEGATRAADSDQAYSGALLDINLRGQLVYPAAEKLMRRGVPLIFLTGYATDFLPEAFGGCPLLEKPFSATELRVVMARNFGARS